MKHVWRHISQSAQGLSHIAEGTPCQDNNRVVVLPSDSDESLVACVADGAGSAKHGDFGSQTTCESIIASARSYMDSQGSFQGLSKDDVLEWCDAAIAQIREGAKRREYEIRDCATTLCTAIISPQSSCFFQIGDGAMTVRRHGVYGVVFWPQGGEYANTTNFITGKDYRDHLLFDSTTYGFSDVALFTDGIERLALRFDGQVPHAPFFEPLFQVLRAGNHGKDLSGDLRKFLESDSIQSRTDDDKTLILASMLSEETGDHR